MSNPSALPEGDHTIYKTLLESTKAIPWQIDWATLRFTYIGPQIEQLLGWQQDSWLSVDDWASRMHPEDRERVVNFCVAQSQAGSDHEADYRALTQDGRYVWIRDVVHVVRNEQGDVESLIGFMFDISERKQTEHELMRLQQELQELSFKDSLTGVANRRMFDNLLEEEWIRARRQQHPLSLLIFDIDYFKQYNDCYGHVQGDDCLRQVAQILDRAATRSRDFFARYGGEEFVLLLPETDEISARKVAERCRSLIFKEQIPHAGSAVSQLLTLSIGVGCCVPTPGQNPMEFVDQVDRLLYRAKERGRNCIIPGF
ncbi:GGDEF domain-containing protein [Nitrincola tapanii]|uniref:diguanylate cyclase n=1 Tax=Nitrincola tapanii TaxID=1708751 RepID=A0A5A9W0J5_9GAMM|nr:sensor domain-containing diguanylate cyclase [Nitrincola tapanii]KAA0874290.1 sensor domain-containing diguanylate cyclase [Nitrincola tapanii]